MCRQTRYCNGDSDIKAVILHAGLGAIGPGSQMSNLQVFIADTLGSWRSHETSTSHDKHKWKNMMNRLCSLTSTRRHQTPKTSPCPWAFYPVVAAVLLWNLLNVPLWVKKGGKEETWFGWMIWLSWLCKKQARLYCGEHRERVCFWMNAA